MRALLFRTLPLTLACLIGATCMTAAEPDRIAGSIDNTRYVALTGQTPRMARPELDRGPVDAAQRISGVSLDLSLTQAQQADLDTFLEDQRNPNSPDYHNWLTPTQFADRFGSSPNDVARIVAWLQSQGFSIQHVGTGRTWILFAGTADQIAQTFHTSLRHYFVDGNMHYANDSVPSIPEALNGVVVNVRGLDDFHPKPATSAAKAKQITPQLDRGGYQFVGPADFATIYDVNALYSAGADGTGQKIAIAGQTDIALLDISEFRSLFNLPANPPQIVLVGDDPGVSSGDEVEADLDVEWSGAAAKNATILYVNSVDVFLSLQYAIDEALAPVVSVSYGGCEAGEPTASFRTMAQQANAEGITWMNAAGDQGAAGCDYGAEIAVNGPSVIFPADIPEVTAVGGTEFDEGSGTYWSTTNGNGALTALGYIPEMVWNDTSPGNPIEAGGGGKSNAFSKPWWQSGPGVPADGARDVPDISMDASADHDGYIIVSTDIMMSIGGTSVSSPAFAGIVSLLNQYLVQHGTLTKPGLGNINPTLYALAPNSTGIFHDITVGNNIVPCQVDTTGCTTGSFGYDAGPGYDLATGLGTVDAYNLATGWTKTNGGTGVTISLISNPPSIATTGSAVITATVTAVSGSTAPTGTITFTTGATSLGTATLVAGSGGRSTATFSLKGSSLVAGANTITADYMPTGSFLASSGTMTVTVTGTGTTLSFTANPSTFAASANTTLTATVRAASGTANPTGTVTFSVNGTTIGTAPVVGTTASGSVAGSKFEVGYSTIIATFAGTGTFADATSNIMVQVTAVNTTTTVTGSPATFASNASTVVSATIRPTTGSGSPTGDVIFMLGDTNLGTVQVVNSVASMTIKGSSLVLGSNTITCYYGATGDYNSSQGTGTLTLTPPPVATTVAVAGNPSTVIASSSTTISARVTPASGNTAPTGTLTFKLGAAILGTGTLSGGAASISVQGINLSPGANTITATYTPTGNFAAATGTGTVTITPVATTTTVSASPTLIAPTASTTLTVTVKPTSGTTAPTGTVTFTIGNKSLGSVTFNGATATITIKGSSLSVGSNSITATYVPFGSFSTSNASITVTVT